MKKILLLCLAAFFIVNVQAQDDKATLIALKAEADAKKAEVDAVTAELGAIQAKIDALPGWRKGALGIIGIDWKGSNNWYANAFPNSSSNSVGFAGTAYAHNIQDKYFWRNNASLNIGALRFTELGTDGEPVAGAEDKLRVVTDAFQLTSLYGYRLSPKIAISAMADYRTVVIGSDTGVDSTSTGFNNPGYLDIGAGITWTPMENLVAVIHPINYNIVFANDALGFVSSLGTKYVVDYTQKLPMGIAWTSNLSGFFSYKDNSPGASLHNTTWTNGFSFTAFKGIGVSAQVGLRWNEQEATLLGGNPVGENPMQSFYVIGLSYSL